MSLTWGTEHCASWTCAAISLQICYTQLNEVADNDVSCQVGKAYNNKYKKKKLMYILSILKLSLRFSNEDLKVENFQN